MVRLKNKTTGVVVNVDDETAKRLGNDWQSPDAAPKRKPGRPRKAESE